MRDEALQFRRTERRHMIRVKAALAAAIEMPVDHAALALACVDHLGFIIRRFLAQGRHNISHLEPRIMAADDREGRLVISDIARTLAACELEFSQLEQAAAGLDAAGSEAMSVFVDHARHFVAFYDATLASRKDPAQQIIRRHFSDEEYWTLTDDITDAVIREEQRLYSRVVELAPAAIAGPLTAPWPATPPA